MAHRAARDDTPWALETRPALLSEDVAKYTRSFLGSTWRQWRCVLCGKVVDSAAPCEWPLSISRLRLVLNELENHRLTDFCE